MIHWFKLQWFNTLTQFFLVWNPRGVPAKCLCVEPVQNKHMKFVVACSDLQMHHLLINMNSRNRRYASYFRNTYGHQTYKETTCYHFFLTIVTKRLITIYNTVQNLKKKQYYWQKKYGPCVQQIVPTGYQMEHHSLGVIGLCSRNKCTDTAHVFLLRPTNIDSWKISNDWVKLFKLSANYVVY